MLTEYWFYLIILISYLLAHTFYIDLARRNDLHPPKPKRNMGKSTFKYAGAIYFSSLPNCVKSATSVNSFKNMLIKHFSL